MPVKTAGVRGFSPVGEKADLKLESTLIQAIKRKISNALNA